MFLLALLLLIFPWFIFVGLALFALNPEDLTKKYRSRGLCTMPGCIRCNKNKQAFI